MIWCEPRVIITVNQVVTGRFAPGKTDNITNGYAKIQKIIQKDCRNAEIPHCIFRIFAVTTRAPAGDSNLMVALGPLKHHVTTCAPTGDRNGLRKLQHVTISNSGNSSRPCGGQQKTDLSILTGRFYFFARTEKTPFLPPIILRKAKNHLKKIFHEV